MKTVQYAVLMNESRKRWFALSKAKQERLKALPFVSKITDGRVYFDPCPLEWQIKDELDKELLSLTKTAEYKFHYIEERAVDRLSRKLREPGNFYKLSFGSDVAELDKSLATYFVSTPSYKRVEEKTKSIVIGPKGSGKSAILRIISDRPSSGHAVVITPEVFATSVLSQFVDDGSNVWDEEEAFVSTWIFSILVEVLKRITDNPRGIKGKDLKKIKAYLSSNARYRNVDLFTRFIGYLKTIQGVKLGDYEITLKTRMLQELYALEDLYGLVPELRNALKDDILVLIDELDQGWDNSAHSNRFVASLMRAAMKIQNLGLKIQVVVFVRSEIFDLVKSQLDQLDKLRSGIEVIKWRTNELASLVLKRVAHNFNIVLDEADSDLLRRIFPDSIYGMSGFDYLLSRTSRRPREVLQFVRQAHLIAVETKRRSIGKDAITRAEEEFSSWKLEHLCAEYKYILPRLEELLWMFRSHGPVLDKESIKVLITEYKEDSDLPSWASVSEEELLQRLYMIEFIGVRKPQRSYADHGFIDGFEFSYERPSANVKRSHTFLVHPAFWKALEIDAI